MKFTDFPSGGRLWLNLGLVVLLAVTTFVIGIVAPSARAQRASPPASATFQPGAADRLGDQPSASVLGDQYRLIGWNDLGMHCLDDTFDVFSILPPYNNLWAQLLRMPADGSAPELVSDGVTIEYSFLDNSYSAGKVNFWQHVSALFGVSLAPNVGLAGNGMAGQMTAFADHFVAEGVPLTPYNDSTPSTRKPYQQAHIVARDASNGQILAETTFVAPVSDEMNCKGCHYDGGVEDIATGNWRLNILTLHDREEHTNLASSQPVLCADCHAAPALGLPGVPGVPNLSRAMHGKHAPEDKSGGSAIPNADIDVSQLVSWTEARPAQNPSRSSILLSAPTDEGTNDCYQCHPGPETRCLRDTMSAQGMWCTDCHGDMNAVASSDRQPWLDEPRCGTCHGPEFAENPGKLFRQSTGHGGLFCEACHNSTHAILPSQQPLDNQQVIALQGSAGTLQECAVCHGANIPDGPGPHGITSPGTDTPTPTSTTTATPTRAATSTPTRTATSTPTRLSTATPTRSATATPTRSATATPTRTLTATQTMEPTESPEPTETASPTTTPGDELRNRVYLPLFLK